MAKRARTAAVLEAEPDELELEGEQPEDEDEVTNAHEVPLFAGAGFANNRSICKLRLIKLDQPGAGYKGEIPLNSTLETIGQIFGDGLYNIEAVNAKGRLLRRLENQRISLGMGPMDGSRPAPVAISAKPTTDELARVERLASKAGELATQQSLAYTTMVRDTSESQAQREREFMQNAQAQNQQFFQAMMTAQAQAFQQLLTLMHAAAPRRETNNNNDSVERMLELFSQGLNLGRNLEQPEDPPIWSQILQGGAQILGGARAAQLAANNPNQPNKKQRKAMTEMLALYKAIRRRGMDPSQLLDMLEGGERPPAEQPADEPDDESDDESEESDDESARPIFTRAGDSQTDTQ